MTTLTDRYVETTLRRLPGRQRLDIERELRASIADAVDGRVEAGEAAGVAETAVLTELGDPARLAAGYADRPLHLIGPALFVDYTRVLTALLAGVVPIVAAVVALVGAFDGDSPGSIIGSTIGAAITTAVHIAVWVTLFFAVLERTGGRWTPTQPWTPAALPMPPSRRMRYGELIAECVATVVLSALILLSPVLGLHRDAQGDPIPVLSPWLWDTGIVYVFLALVVGSLVFSFAKYYAKWSLPLALTGALVQFAPSVIMIWLAANDRVINPAFIESFGWPESATRWIGPGLIIVGVIGILSTISETVRHARQR
jgi:hypothetical protein